MIEIEVEGTTYRLERLNGWALVRLGAAGVEIRPGSPANRVYEIAASLRAPDGKYLGDPDNCRTEIAVVQEWTYAEIQRIGAVVDSLNPPALEKKD